MATAFAFPAGRAGHRTGRRARGAGQRPGRSGKASLRAWRGRDRQDAARVRSSGAARIRAALRSSPAGPTRATLPRCSPRWPIRCGRRAASEPDLWAAVQHRQETLAAVLPELVGPSPGRIAVDRPLLFEALLDVVEEAAGGRATLWFLEDLHWADPSTWDFVVYAARRVGSMALALVVTFRDEELPHGLLWLARFPTLRREPDTVEIGLGRLDRAETRALIQALDPLLPGEAVDRIAERSAGTPLLIEELVATFGAHPEAVPDVIAMTVRERIRRVDPAVRPVLEAVAVGGPQLDSALLFRVLPDPPADALDQLTAAGLRGFDRRRRATCDRVSPSAAVGGRLSRHPPCPPTHTPRTLRAGMGGGRPAGTGTSGASLRAGRRSRGVASMPASRPQRRVRERGSRRLRSRSPPWTSPVATNVSANTARTSPGWRSRTCSWPAAGPSSNHW